MAESSETPIRTERHIETKDQLGVTCLKGHSKQVTCLSVTMDCTRLASGSHDSSAKIWDIYSGQCLRTLTHKGQVTNTLIVPTPPAVNNLEMKPTLPLLPFKRYLYTGENNSDDADVLNIRLTGQSVEDEEENQEGGGDLSDLLQQHSEPL